MSGSATGDAARPNRGPLRLLRAGVLGGSSLTLAAGAHLAGGGVLPSSGVLLVVALLLGLGAVSLTARRCRFGVLLGVLGVQQLVLHWVFGAAAGVSGGCGAVMSALQHHAGMLADPGALGPSCAGMAGTMSGGSPAWTMWLAHATAVAATAWLLTRGEAWLWRTADTLVEAATAAPSERPTNSRTTDVWTLIRIDLPLAAASPAAPRGPPVRSK